MQWDSIGKSRKIQIEFCDKLKIERQKFLQIFDFYIKCFHFLVQKQQNCLD